MTEFLWLFGGMLAVLVVPILPIAFWSMRHEARKRELEHVERMKALELGQSWPPGPAAPAAVPAGDGVSAASRRCFGIAAGMPVAAFFGAQALGGPPGAHSGLWTAATAISVTGLVCGTVLTLHAPAPMPAPSKPVVEPDAFDLVARRG